MTFTQTTRNTREKFAVGSRVAALMLGLWLVLTPRPALAALTFNVNSNTDVIASAPLDTGACETAPGNGVCTLRAAIMKANHTPGGGATVHVPACACLYQLTIPDSGSHDETTGDLNVTASMTIVGDGAANTVIDGNGSVVKDRVFNVNGVITVTISDVTIQNGKAVGDLGGGVRTTFATVLSNRSIVAGNTAAAYGGIVQS